MLTTSLKLARLIHSQAPATTANHVSQQHLKQAPKRILRVAIVGAPNAGKSTLLNRLVESQVSCVSNKVHTTRKNVLGVYTQDETQLEFYDAPGLVTRRHLLKHKLEQSLLTDPTLASQKCDLIAALVDASNIREQKRLNTGLIELLSEHSDKISILILNKVDLIKEKRKLLDIGTRLSEGCIDGKLALSLRDLKRLPSDRLKELNLVNHLERSKLHVTNTIGHKDDDRQHDDGSGDGSLASRPKRRYVIELTKEEHQDQVEKKHQQISYPKFSRIFSISALEDDGVDELREHMISMAKPAHEWPHGQDYLTNQSTQDIVSNIIRGKVMDFVDGAIPYLLSYKFLNFTYDEWGSLHIQLSIYCPEKYMYGKVLGEKGVTISRIIDESREIISNTLGCDVKLSVQVEIK